MFQTAFIIRANLWNSSVCAVFYDVVEIGLTDTRLMKVRNTADRWYGAVFRRPDGCRPSENLLAFVNNKLKPNRKRGISPDRQVSQAESRTLALCGNNY